jgi:hypothetical protein
MSEQTMKPNKSLRTAFKHLGEWLDERDADDEVDYLTQKINDKLVAEGPLSKGILPYLEGFGSYYGNVASAAFGNGDTQTVAEAVPKAVAFRSLAFRFGAMDLPVSSRNLLPGTMRLGLPPFKTSMRAIGPAMLSDWPTMAINTPLLIAYVEAEMAQRLKSELAKHWGNGSIDAFVIGLLSQAFDVPTTYKSVHPLVPQFKSLLEHWRTTDESTFREVMQQAAEYHISRSKHHTDKTQYEFNAFFEWVFPAELLAVQALRQRDGLPAFEAGHALVDAPWAMIRNLSPAQPDPLLEQVEARLRADYPNVQ